MGFWPEQWKQIRGHAKWEFIRIVFGGGVLATAYALFKATTIYWRTQILLFVLCALGFAVITLLQKRGTKGEAELPVLTVVSHEFTNDAGATYPLKMRVQFRNDSTACVSVRVTSFKEGLAPMQHPFPVSVLQVSSGKWFPESPADQIAVLPGQLFRVWIGFDATSTDKNKLQQLKGRLGTLTLTANNQPSTFSL